MGVMPPVRNRALREDWITVAVAIEPSKFQFADAAGNLRDAAGEWAVCMRESVPMHAQSGFCAPPPSGHVCGAGNVCGGGGSSSGGVPIGGAAADMGSSGALFNPAMYAQHGFATGGGWLVKLSAPLSALKVLLYGAQSQPPVHAMKRPPQSIAGSNSTVSSLSFAPLERACALGERGCAGALLGDAVWTCMCACRSRRPGRFATAG